MCYKCLGNKKSKGNFKSYYWVKSTCNFSGLVKLWQIDEFHWGGSATNWSAPSILYNKYYHHQQYPKVKTKLSYCYYYSSAFPCVTFFLYTPIFWNNVEWIILSNINSSLNWKTKKLLQHNVLFSIKNSFFFACSCSTSWIQQVYFESLFLIL